MEALPSVRTLHTLLSSRRGEDAERQEAARRMVANKLRAGAVLLKWGRNGKSEHRSVWVADDLSSVFWGKPKELRRKSKGELPRSSVSDVVAGLRTAVLRRVAGKVREDCCFSIVAADRTLDFECVSGADRDLWVLAFGTLLGDPADDVDARPAPAAAPRRPSVIERQLSAETLTEEVRELRSRLAAAEAEARREAAAKEEALRRVDELEEEVVVVPDAVAEPGAAAEERDQLRDELRAAAERAEKLEARVARLTEKNAALAGQREEMLQMDRDQQSSYLTAEIDLLQSRLADARRQLRLERAHAAGLEAREARRERMAWAVPGAGDGDEGDPVPDAGAPPEGAEFAVSDEPWSDAQRRVLAREAAVLGHYFPGARLANAENQGASVVLPGCGAGGGVEFTFLLRGYPALPPEALVTAPRDLKDREGRPLLAVGASDRTRTLEPRMGFVRPDLAPLVGTETGLGRWLSAAQRWASEL